MRSSHRPVLVRLAVGSALSVTVVAIAVGSLRSGPGVEVAGRVQTMGAREAAAGEVVTYDEGVELLTTYLVRGEHLTPQATRAHQELWRQATRVLPDPILARVAQLDVVTDGPGRMLAQVHRSPRHPRRWILSIDPAESAEVLERTLVHELAHMLTLGAPDLEARHAGRPSCGGRVLTIGCAHPGSLLDRFAARFWTGSREPAPFDADRFASRYAASAAHEDLAETFMAWVYGRTATGVLGEKLDWMAHQPGLVANRAAVRDALGLD